MKIFGAVNVLHAECNGSVLGLWSTLPQTYMKISAV